MPGGDAANAIATDSSGNIYVTGSSYGVGTGVDYATVSYDSSGNERWVARYNGPGNYIDNVYDITTDPSGNIYITGWSYGSGTDKDYATISYDSLGNERWIVRYNGLANSNDEAHAIATDLSGNVYVTGVSDGIETGGDYTTVSYDSFGNERWIVRYNGWANSNDAGAEDIATDLSGNIYVTGWSYVTGTDYDYTTIKYSISEVPCSLIITSPNEGDIFCTGQEIMFTAVTTPVGYEHLIQWSGGGEPATGTGANFTTKFSTDGEKTITASCDGSSVTRTVTILPETSNCKFTDFSRKIKGPLSAVESVLKKVPGVKEADTSISADVEECDCCYLGTIIEKGEVSGNFGVSLTGSGSKPLVGLPPLNIPIITYDTYRVKITVEFDVNLTGEISADGNGTVKQECGKELCVGGSFGISGTITAEAKGEAKICAKRPMEPGNCWGVDLTPASLSTGVSGNYELDTCGENQGELCWDGLEYEATIEVRIPFTRIKFEKGIKHQIWDKKCWPG